MKKSYKLIGTPNWITIAYENGTISCPSNESGYYGEKSIHLAFEENEKQTDIFVQSKEVPLLWVKLRWNIKIPRSSRFMGDAWERGYGDFEWRSMIANRFMPWYFLADHGDTIWGYGVRVRPSSMCFWQVDSEGITLFLDVRCGGMGVKLGSRKLKAASVIACEFKECSAFKAAELFCKSMCEDPILPDHPVYGSNNWYYAYGDSSEQEILKDTDYLLSLTNGFDNPPYMVIDDCWQEHHRINEYNGGPWTKGNRKFPGMKQLAEKIRKKGARPGLWIRLLLNEDENIPQKWRLSHNGCLDPSHPEALAYIQQDVKRVCNWGYTLIKHDFSTFDLFGRWGFEMNPCVTEGNWHFYDRSKTSAEVVKMFYKAILESTKEFDTVILGCNTIGHLGAGFMHINRTGDDTSGLNWERTRKIGINTLAFRLPQHRAFYDVDADCVGITGKIPWKLNRQWAEVIANSGTPLFISVQPGVLNQEEKTQLSSIIHIASEQKKHAIPVDWQDTDCPEIWQAGSNIHHYHWYEKEGLKFSENPERYQTFLSII
ncbi:alpha-galactosidase [Sporolactobacillus sp. THM7-7]|nr:alpha-galactosidase [Sporolactobacillus sp. THM7-7]